MSFISFETLKNAQKIEQEVAQSLLCTAPLAANQAVVKKDNSYTKIGNHV